MRTAIAVQAFAAATNLLDKVACPVDLYYRTRRKTIAVSFRYPWHRRTQKTEPGRHRRELADQFADGRGNRGLMAVCDLRLEKESPLNELVERRHSATHRFLTVHSMLFDSEERDTGGWIASTGTKRPKGAMRLLSTARAAIYLARTTDFARAVRCRAPRRRGRRNRPPRLPPEHAAVPRLDEHPDFE